MNYTDRPEISVLLPVRNGMPFLKDAVESILLQTFKCFELIVLDDGSTDDTPIFVKSFNDNRIVYFRVDRSSDILDGRSQILNHGLRMAKGRFVARMDADDIAFNCRFEKQLAMFEESPKLVLSSVQFQRINQSGELINTSEHFHSDAALRFNMLFSTGILHPGAMFKRDVAIEIGGYSTTYDVAEDYDFFTRMSNMGEISNSESLLLKYRVWENNCSTKHSDRQLEQSTAIASNYAKTLFKDSRLSDWSDVHRVCIGRYDMKSPVPNVALRYNFAANQFLGMYQANDELSSCINFWKNRLRWRCLHMCSSKVVQPTSRVYWFWNACRLGLKLRSVVKSFYNLSSPGK